MNEEKKMISLVPLYQFSSFSSNRPTIRVLAKSAETLLNKFTLKDGLITTV